MSSRRAQICIPTVCKLDRLNAIIPRMFKICVRKGSYTEIRTFVHCKFRRTESLLENTGQFLGSTP